MSSIRITLTHEQLGDETFFKYKAEYKSAAEEVRLKLGEVETLLASGAAENSEKYKYLEQYRDMIKDTLADYEKQADESTDSVRLPESDSLGQIMPYEKYHELYEVRLLRRLRHPRRATTLRDYVEEYGEEIRAERNIELVEDLLHQNKLTLEDIAAIAKVPLEQVERIAQKLAVTV